MAPADLARSQYRQACVPSSKEAMQQVSIFSNCVLFIDKHVETTCYSAWQRHDWSTCQSPATQYILEGHRLILVCDCADAAVAMAAALNVTEPCSTGEQSKTASAVGCAEPQYKHIHKARTLMHLQSISTDEWGDQSLLPLRHGVEINKAKLHFIQLHRL